MATSSDELPTGNTYDKYHSNNPIARWLMKRFESTVLDFIAEADPDDLLDVGCGEGFMLVKLAKAYPDVPMEGIDLEDPELKKHWQQFDRPNVSFGTDDAMELSRDANTFHTVTALEVLEHLPDPERALRQITRVARDWIVVSVPREPLWRVLNMARGAYLFEFGNTPGHINHWSKGRFIEFVETQAEVVRVESPLPWTVVLARV